MNFNEDTIEIFLKQLKDRDYTVRWFAAHTLGDIGRSKENFREEVLEALEEVSGNDENAEVRRAAERSIREIHGERDQSSEKYKPQEPVGSLRDQYYLKRG